MSNTFSITGNNVSNMVFEYNINMSDFINGNADVTIKTIQQFFMLFWVNYGNVI